MKIRRSLLLLALLASLLVSVYTEDDDDDGDVEVEVEDDDEQTREKPVYRKPVLRGNVHFAEPFHTKEDFLKRWVISEAKKDNTDESIAKYDGKWSVEEPSQNAMVGDLGLILKSKAKHHAVSAPLAKPFDFSGKPFIMQYEVRFQNGMECGGAYVKLLSKDSKLSLSKFHDKTPYTIMFGPDKCGNDHKLHFIFRHKNPKTGEIEEKHAKKPTSNIDSFFSDKKTHLYTLVVKPDNTFEIKVDGNIVNEGSLLEDFSPSVNPPKNIEDPNDKKPEDWDEREKIADPDASKPDDWDESEPEMIEDEDAVKPEGWLDNEPKLIPDPVATKPEDWDDEMDGEWEAPLIDNEKCSEAPGCGEWKKPSIKNPKYKGKWHAPIIDNPNYKGIWKPKMINNPNYFEDNNPYQMTPITGLGLELWSMTEDILFDNFLITDDFDVVESWTESSWTIKNMEEKASSSSLKTMFQGLLDATKDRPWLWVVFIVVIAIPLVVIFIYCCMTPKNIWNTLKSSADQRPWLWAVYVVVLLLPVVLLSICFCPKSGPIKAEDLAASRKKTDEVSPDDADRQEEDEDEDKNKTSVGPGGDNQTSTKSKKSDLDSKPDEDAGDDADEEEEEEEDKVKESPRQRKRRVRKD